MPKKKEPAKAEETTIEEVAKEVETPVKEGPELEPGQYVRVVHGVKYLAYTDVNGISYDLRKL